MSTEEAVRATLALSYKFDVTTDHSRFMTPCPVCGGKGYEPIVDGPDLCSWCMGSGDMLDERAFENAKVSWICEQMAAGAPF